MSKIDALSGVWDNSDEVTRQLYVEWLKKVVLGDEEYKRVIEEEAAHDQKVGEQLSAEVEECSR